MRKWWGNGQSIGSTAYDAIVRVAGCGRLQLGAAHWATLVALLQAVDNSGSRVSTVGALYIEGFPFTINVVNASLHTNFALL